MRAFFLFNHQYSLVLLEYIRGTETWCSDLLYKSNTNSTTIGFCFWAPKLKRSTCSYTHFVLSKHEWKITQVPLVLLTSSYFSFFTRKIPVGASLQYSTLRFWNLTEFHEEGLWLLPIYIIVRQCRLCSQPFTFLGLKQSLRVSKNSSSFLLGLSFTSNFFLTHNTSTIFQPITCNCRRRNTALQSPLHK